MRPSLGSLEAAPPVVEGALPSWAGLALLGTLQAIRELVGESTYARGEELLPVPTRDALAEVTALTWVPITTVDAVIDTVAKTALRDPEQLLAEALRVAVTRTFTSLWQPLMRVTTEAALVARAPGIYARTRNVGELSASISAPGRMALVLSGWRDVPTRQLRMIGVSIATIIELTGRADVRVRGTHTSAGGHYSLTWSR